MGFWRRCLLSSTLVAVLSFVMAVPGMAEERIVQVSPSGQVAAGQDVILRITTREILPPAEATLHYRTIGSADFLALPMNKDSEVVFTAILPGQKLLPPGIEYFFSVTDNRGRRFTLPKLNPRKNPISLAVDLGGAAFRNLAFPSMDGARIEGSQPTIVINLADIEGSSQWSSLRLLVDDVDVSPLASVVGREIRYAPETPLDFGRHSVVLQSMDADGVILPTLNWTFVVPQSESFDKASASLTIDAEISGKIASRQNNAEPDWKFQSSTTLNSVVERGDVRVSFDANGWLLEQEGEEEIGNGFNLNNYLLQVDYRGQRLALGDLSVEATELLGGSIARRGALLEINTERTQAQAFVVQSMQTTGSDDATGLERSDQRMIGGSLKQELLDNDRLIVKGTAIKGQNTNTEGYNSATLAPPSKGRVYSLALSSIPGEGSLNLNGEYSISRYDRDTTDDLDSDSGRAWLLRFSGQAGSYDYGGGYKHLGDDFRSIASITGVDNREEYILYGTKTFTESNLTTSLLHNRDNLDKDPQLPVIRNSSLDLVWNLYKTDWPSIFLNGNLTRQASSDEPSGTDPIQNLSQTLGGGFSVIREVWSLMPSYTYTRFSDDSPRDADSRTHQATVSFGWQPGPRVSFNPSVSYGRTETASSATTTETWQGTLAGNFVFNERQNLYLTLSMLDSQADDSSVDATSYDGVCQYNWNLVTSFWKNTQKTLSLRGRFNRNDDRAGNTVEEDYAVFLILSLGGLSLSSL